MQCWWEIGSSEAGGSANLVRTVAYYRHSAQDRQENSIPIQRDQVREWASKNGVEIIHEFADAGKSGLNAEGRPAFTEMMEEWVKKRSDFDYVLCLDVSRWGRFQDIDLSAQFSAECRKHKKQIIYTSIGKPREDDPLYPVYVQFERFRACPIQSRAERQSCADAPRSLSKANRWSKQRIIEAIQDGYVRGLPIERPGFNDQLLAGAARRHYGDWETAVAASGICVKKTNGKASVGADARAKIYLVNEKPVRV